MASLKLQRPLTINGNNIYPLTTYDQIIMSDGKKWNGKAGSDIQIEPLIASGTKLATITVDGVGKDLWYQASTVNLNGADTTSAKFYAPTAAGTSGYILKSNGSGTAPTWGALTAGNGIAISGLTIANTGVRSIATGSANGTISVNTNGSSADVAVKGLGSNAYTSTAYLPLAGGTMTGRLIINYSNDAAMGTALSGTLIIGDPNGNNITIDNNEILCKKTDGKTADNLNIQTDGGTLTLGTKDQNLNLKGKIYATGAVYVNNNASNPDIGFMPTYNNSALMGIAQYQGPYSTTENDGSVTYTYRSRFMFRCYSTDASPYTSRLSYYTNYYLPNCAQGLTANATKYIVCSGQSGYYDGAIKSTASTSKAYVCGVTAANGAMLYNSSVYTSGSVLYGACWNDYAEYRAQTEEIKPGYITYSEDDGKLRLTTEKFQKFEGVVSDTFGFSIGETDECKTPLAVSGRVLVYVDPEDEFHSGDCVCAGPGGLAYRMTREEVMMYPDRIVGVVSEIPIYDTWGTGNVPVDGRIWIKVK